MIRVAINGYGRIGRLAHRIIIDTYSQDIDVVAINAGASTDINGWMYLLKYDTAYGTLNKNIRCEKVNDQNSIGNFYIDEKKIPVYAQKDPSILPWKDLDVDVVIEATGHLLTKEKAGMHIGAGAKKVVMSAPPKDDSKILVLSVNEEE